MINKLQKHLEYTTNRMVSEYLKLPSLRGVTAYWRIEDNTACVTFYFHDQISENDQEEASDLCAGIIANFPEGLLEERYVRLDYPAPLPEQFLVYKNDESIEYEKNERGESTDNEENSEQIELEMLLRSRAGTGNRVCGSICEPGFRERVEFGKVIGSYARIVEGKPTEYIPTSKGIIHYHSNGSAHIVPCDPIIEIDCD
jgi:hypothetical protein